MVGRHSSLVLAVHFPGETKKYHESSNFRVRHPFVLTGSQISINAVKHNC